MAESGRFHAMSILRCFKDPGESCTCKNLILNRKRAERLLRHGRLAYIRLLCAPIALFLLKKCWDKAVIRAAMLQLD